MKKKLLFHHILLLSLLLFLSGCIREEWPAEAGLTGGESWVTIPFCSDTFDQVQITTKATLGIIPESRVSNLFLFLFDGTNGSLLYSHFFDSDNQVAGPTFDDSATAWWVTNTSDHTAPMGDSTPISSRSHGAVRIKAPNMTGAKLYAIANINADMVSISPESLSLIRTKTELDNLTAHLIQDVVTRNGFFPMVDIQENITISAGSITQGGNPPGLEGATWRLELERLDAKINVTVRFDTGADGNGRVKNFIPESWQVINVPQGCNIFPASVTRNGVAGCDTDGANAEGYTDTTPLPFEDATVVVDGNHTWNNHSFSFYMMENREAAQKAFPSQPYPDGVESAYHLRDRRLKYDSGPNTGKYMTGANGEIWEYAPEEGTYVIIKGEIKLNLTVEEQEHNNALNGYVTYIFHLGDFATSADNFKVERNTIYNYTLTVTGVDNIQAEVSSSHEGVFQEKNSGAMGSLNIVRETAYTFDAHFGQRAFRFDADHIDYDPDIEKMNTRWYVQTPFGLTGVPPQHGGQDVTIGYDYDWVHFRVNKFCTDSDLNHATYGGTGNPADPNEPEFSCYYKLSYNQYYNNNPEMNGLMPYKHNNEKYNSEGVMDVVAFCRYMREERQKLQKYFNYLNKAPGDPIDYDTMTTTNTSAFRVEFSKEWYDWAKTQGQAPINNPNYDTEEECLAKARRYSIWVTCYVDEYYYEDDPVHPIYGGNSPGAFITTGNEFWKKFCNQSDRMMFILCSNDFSLDGDSDYTGSVISIIQHSIQTPYNTARASLQTAWGTEITDETGGFGWFYAKGGPKESGLYENSKTRTIPAGAYIHLPRNSTNNGLFNSASNWLFTSDESGNMISFAPDTYKWEDYLDYEAVNDLPYVNLKDDANHRNQSLRMACLMRNRDLDGDGYIDPEEIRWYMASTEQIYGLFLGGISLTEESQTFTKAMSNRTGYYDRPEYGYYNVDAWRSHIVTSSIYSYANNGSSTGQGKTLPHVVFAEEGAGGTPGAYRSDFYYDNAKKQGRYTARCVRNLGLPDATAEDLAWTNLENQTYHYTDASKIPTPLVSAKLYAPDGTELAQSDASNNAKNGYYVFDCDNIDPRALRFRSTVELEPSDQLSDICRLYRGFTTGPLMTFSRDVETLVSDGVFTQAEINELKAVKSERPTAYDVIYKRLISGDSPCPPGYRVPNLREATAIVLYATNMKWWEGIGDGFITGTWDASGYNYGNKKNYVSLTGTGKENDEKIKDTWRIKRKNATEFDYSLGNSYKQNRTRCVKDTDPE